MNRRAFLAIPFAAAAGALSARRVRAAREPEPPEFRRVVELITAHHLRDVPIGDAIVAIGRGFLGTPYVGNTLEINDREACVINFSGLDCVTFFELSLDCARIAKKNVLTYDALEREVTFTRYRGGHLTDYTSRLHYTSDWFHDNEQKHVVRNLTAELGGVPYEKKIDFMSTHPDKYKQLREHPAFVAVIKKCEEAIAARRLLYVPKVRVAGIEPHLHDGDIIGITTTIAGIDCSHTGLIVKEGDRARFLHASSVKGKVIIADGTLSDYLNSVSKHTGIMVVRPLECAMQNAK